MDINWNALITCLAQLGAGLALVFGAAGEDMRPYGIGLIGAAVGQNMPSPMTRALPVGKGPT